MSFSIRPLRLTAAFLLLVAGCSSSSTPSTPSNGDAAKADAGTEPAPTKRAFVTHATFTGNLKAEGKASSALDGADALCAAAATGAGLTGTWTAWVSTALTDASTRIDTNTTRVFVDGKTKIFDPMGSDGWNALRAFNVDEAGNAIGEDNVWTATDAFGHFKGNTGNTSDGATENACEGWTSASGSNGSYPGQTGGGGSSTDWTYLDFSGSGMSSELPCDDANHLFCFEK